MLVYDEKEPTHFWKNDRVTPALPSRDSEIKRAILRIKKTNAILKRFVNKLFPIEYTYHETVSYAQRSVLCSNSAANF